ncbi:hypothetical protein BDZ94DRAFT_1262314 [Collybia nuda]|uniref:Uncharacterized protein n=1 Tax=Collybia nuda TaxID=64659 RepID=A0A9P5Y4E7_9AGAR|nr:hypothetical protein BDZ94DRAFT_1262314 [Collybia nuda]
MCTLTPPPRQDIIWRLSGGAYSYVPLPPQGSRQAQASAWWWRPRTTSTDPGRPLNRITTSSFKVKFFLLLLLLTRASATPHTQTPTPPPKHMDMNKGIGHGMLCSVVAVSGS